MSQKQRVFWGLRTFCIVTGASRGIGQEIAIEFAKKFKNGSLMLLMARTEKGLLETKAKIEASAPGVNVKSVAIDLGEPTSTSFYNAIANTLREYRVTASNFEHALLFNNAGSMINAIMGEEENLERIHAYMKFNVYSPMILTVQFLKIFHDQAGVPKRSVLQTSTMLSQVALRTSGLYSMTKAARNMYFQTLAVENPTVDVFSYGPGPTDTGFLEEDMKKLDPAMVAKMKASGKIVSVPNTVKHLIKLLTDGDYESGQFKDIYTPEQYAQIL